jgi:epsilon-lactone hydrolase
MVSPEALKLNELLRNAPKAVDMDLPHQREAGEHAEDMTSEPEGVRFDDAPAVGGLWATPRSWDGESAIMYLYGGGYVISSPHSRRKLAGHLANAAGARALVPKYHLAPSALSHRPSTTPRPTTGGCSARGIDPSGSSSPGIRAPVASR